MILIHFIVNSLSICLFIAQHSQLEIASREAPVPATDQSDRRIAPVAIGPVHLFFPVPLTELPYTMLLANDYAVSTAPPVTTDICDPY
jgi:hypothetical protein